MTRHAQPCETRSAPVVGASIGALALVVGLLAGCGSDSSDSSGGSGGTGGGSPAGGGRTVATDAAARGGDVDGPCDLTDQATVASVFPGAGAGKPGKVRNCEFKTTGGTVNVFYFEDLTVAEYKKQDLDNDIKVTDLSVGDGGFRDQLGTVAVGKDDYSFAVQFLPASGLKDISKYDAQTLPLARKIFADL